MGLVARPAIPALIRALREDKDDSVRQCAAEALCYLGSGNSNATVALREALADQRLEVRVTVTNALKVIDHEAAIRILRWHERSDLRSWAARSLGYNRGGDKATIAALSDALVEDEFGSVRIAAAQALGTLGGADDAALAALTRALEDESRYVRMSATNALLQLAPEAAARAGVKAPSP
jgi:HEAT repeat protein